MREVTLAGYKITIDGSQATATLAQQERLIEAITADMVKLGKSADDVADAVQKMGALNVHQLDRVHKGVTSLNTEYAKTSRAQEKLASTTKHTASAMEHSLASLGRTLVAAFAFDRIAAFTGQIVTTAGHIKDLADRTGLGIGAVQAFGYAAAQSGSSVDTVAKAIGTMSRNIAGGSGSATEAFTRLGLSQQALLSQNPEQAFEAVATAIQSLENPIVQATAAQQVFGRSGAEILAAIKGGFVGAADEARRLGLVISDDTVKALDDVGDAWDRLGLRIRTSLAEAMGSVVTDLAGMVELLTQAPGAAIRTMVRNMGTALEDAGKALPGPTTLEGAAMRLSGMGGLFGSLSGSLLTTYGTKLRESAGPQAMADADWQTVLKVFQSRDRDEVASVIPSRERLATATEKADAALAKLTASTVAYLRTVMPAIGLGATVSSLERAAAYRGPLGSAGSTYLQTGIAGAFQPDPYAGITIASATHPYSMVGLQGAVIGQRGLSNGLAPKTPASFWDGRGGQALGAGIGIGSGAAIGAMTGGDPYAGMVGGAASAIGAAALGTSMSVAALAATTAGIGAAAVGVYMLVKHFTTVSKEVKQARAEVDAFQQSLTSTMTAQQVNEAAGEQWAATAIVIRDAYDRMGYSAAEAEKMTLDLWNTDRPDAARAAMARINDVVSDFRAVLAGVNEQMGDLLGQADTLGQRLPQSLLDALDAAVKLGDMTEENARLIARLTQAPDVDFQKFEQAADRYGINKDALGQAYQQNRTTTTAQQMVDDLDLLHRGGASMGTILHGMREEISALVVDSLKFGTELPGNMQPWIQELLRTKQLVDENGEAITDITRLNFGEDLQTTFQNVGKAILDLVDTLKGPLSNALDEIGRKKVTPTVDLQLTGGDHTIWETPRQPGDQGGNGGDYLRHGGVVYAAQGWPFVPKGTDTVPAMLTPGEGVLSRRGMAMLGRLNSGSAGGGLDEDRLARKIASAVARAIQANPPVMAVDGYEFTSRIVPHIGTVLEMERAWR